MQAVISCIRLFNYVLDNKDNTFQSGGFIILNHQGRQNLDYNK